jgi:hypothetical protein
MGLHTGTPAATAEGYVGIDVHRGARVAALAHGGQVIVSATTAALVEDEPLQALGRHRLKDFDAPAQLFQLGTAEFPPLRTPGAFDLPTPATRFLGRERELFDAATLWLDREPRLLTIIGPGGTGKTRFSIELARFLAEDADGGTVFVPLAPVRDPALVVRLIAERLGASGDDPAAIATRIGEKRTHLVLDNLEQLLPEAARPVAELLAGAPALRLLVTSREPLRIAGEAEFDLPPMDESDAVTLFIARAQAVRPDVGDSPALHELIRRLDRPGRGTRQAPRTRTAARADRPAARPAQERARRGRAPRHAAHHDRLELRPPRRGRTAALRPARRLPRRLHARGGRSGL